MSTTTTHCGTVRLADGRLILKQHRSLPELVQFYRELPEYRWNARRLEWSFLFTPYTAWRLASREELNCSEEVEELAELWRQNTSLDHKREQPDLLKSDSWSHQVIGYWHCASRPAAMAAMDMGAGKSKVAVDLVVNGSEERILILCPLSVVPVWTREFDRWSAIPIRVLAMDTGSTAARAKRLKAELLKHDDAPLVVVVNYDAAWTKAIAEPLLAQKWDRVICDESHRIKSPNGKASKFAFEVGKRATKRLALTGTPMPHSPLDLYGQYRFLDAGIFGTSYARFRQRYAICDERFPGKVLQWKNQDELTKRFNWLSYRVRAEDVLDLPPLTHTMRPVLLGKESWRVYTELAEDLIAEVQGGEVTAANALVKLLRLQQATSGHAKTDDGEVVVLGSEKAAVLAEILEDLPADQPVVVFCRFRHDLTEIQRIARGMSRCYGELSGQRRDALDDKACLAAGVEVAGVQIRSGGVGIDLTAARYAVFYSVEWSLGDYEQALKRLHRPGQKHHVSIFHLLATGTVDHAVYRAFDAKREIIDSVLGELRNGNG